MATRKVNVSSGRFTYGFPGADFPNLDSAVSMAKLEYKRRQDRYNHKIKERFDQALVTEDTSVYLKLTIECV